MSNYFDLGVTVGNTFKLSDQVEQILDSISAELSREEKSRRSFRRKLSGLNFTQKNVLPTLLVVAAPENQAELGHLFSKVLR
jgi:hypothetical protein